MQAAILGARLPRLQEWTARRRALADTYRRELDAAGGPIDVPPECDPGHVYHLFAVRSPRREALRARLSAAGVETLIHYPVPIPRQPALAAESPAPCPVADRVCEEILSLPLYPSMPDAHVGEVARLIREFCEQSPGE
jgi:dTDP-4-amino-4,6-dideoxygalactose transaminase